MRKLILLSIAAVSIFSADTAYAQYRREHHHYYHADNGAWVAPLIGGMVVGGVLGSIFSEPRYDSAPRAYYVERPRCRQIIVGNDYYTNEPVFRKICD
jgi:hypothetical protein